MTNNTLRMSGLNSGLDTEAIVNALTAATKNKINKNQRSILKLQAQQEAYRTIIDKFNAFKNKYFDILNVNSCLKSKTMFNSFKSTLTSSAGTNYVPGVTVSSSANANEASYEVEVVSVATQSTRKSSSDTGKEFDFSNCESGRDYTMKVTVGDKTKTITFTAGDTDDQTIDNINEELKQAFGVTNSGAGRVTLGADKKFTSTDKASVVATSPAWYTNERNVELTGDNALKTGNNSFTITIGETSKTVSFSTIEDGYFDDIFVDNGDGTFSIKDESELDKEGKAKLDLFKQVALNQREGEVYESYDKWWNGYEDENGEWVPGISDEDKAAFAKEIATKEYNDAKQKVEDYYQETFKNVFAKSVWEEQYGEMDPEEEGYKNFTEFAAEFAYTEEDMEAFKHTEEGAVLDMDYKAALHEVDAEFDKYTYQLRDKEVKASYDDYFAQAKQAAYDKAKDAAYAEYQEAKQAAYDQAVADGSFDGDIADFEYEEFEFTSLDKFKYTAADFEAVDEETGEYTNEFYKAHLDEVEAIDQKYEDIINEGSRTVDIDSMSESQRMAMYDKYIYSKQGEEYTEEYYISHFDKDEAVYQFNKSNIENNLNNISFANGTIGVKATYERDGTLTIEGEYKVDGLGDRSPRFAITANANSTNDFGFETTDVTGTASQVSTTSKLNELGLEPDENGNYNLTINGVDFSFSGDTTISEMMKQINASTAGVKMSYTTLTNQFIITANEYGTGVDIGLEDGGQGLLGALGFTGADSEFTEGTNTELIINGESVETASNSYTVDGTTFTFTKAAEGQTFTNEVTRDYSKAMDAIKSFVEDYNKLVEEIYAYVDEEPNSNYYFLTDDDLDEMDLSDSQVTKWETMAKKGLLYRDSTITDIMSSLRTVLYNSVDAADGKKVGLYTLGITTSSDYSNHGKLVFDDTVDFEAMFAQYADEITELFTNAENGIATKFESIIDSATKTTGAAGERGSLVDKAGVSGTASATSNAIYNKIKSLQDLIATLQTRYEQQQDRYWKIYGNMETMLGNLNSQTSYINQLMGNF